MNIIIEILILLCRIGLSFPEAIFRFFVPRTKSLKGKVVLVTGAGRGIGRQLALKFSECGARLALLDINESSAAETARLITESGGTAHSYKCDVTSVRDVSDVADKVRRDLDEVDILVNNAGVLVGKPLLKLEEREIRRTFEINSLAHFWTIREFLPAMSKRKSGHIVCICSMSAKGGTQLLTDYTASKFAVDGLCESLEAELDYLKLGDVIDITTVYPMVVDTRLVSDVSDYCVYQHRFTPMITVDDVADATVRGILTKQRYVYVPWHSKLIPWMAWNIPRKATRLARHFLDMGFFTKD